MFLGPCHAGTRQDDSRGLVSMATRSFNAPGMNFQTEVKYFCIELLYFRVQRESARQYKIYSSRHLLKWYGMRAHAEKSYYFDIPWIKK